MIPKIVERLSKIGVVLTACALTGCELLFVPKDKTSPGDDGGTDASGPSDDGGGGDVTTSDAGADGPAVVDAATPPSCSGLAPSCGPDGGSGCCASATVDGGTFKRSYDAVTFTDASNPATVGPFTLDVYETTVGRFRRFVAAYPYTPLAHSGRNPNLGLADPGWDTSWFGTMPQTQQALIQAMSACDGSLGSTWTGASDDLPINCITWFEAFAFCIWDQGRLPTEAEWNFAAAGGDEQRVYPWSSPLPTSTNIDPNHAVYGASSPLAVGMTSPQGDGKWRHADLAGNVIEWVLDWSNPAYPNPCDNCADFTTASLRVNRGGGFDQSPSALTVSLRSNGDPLRRHSDVGVRCAR
jgi:formylglycine-generating enzyme required for sulfatase activity